MTPRIPFDSLTLACVVDDLRKLQGGRIRHIAQPGEHEIVLTIYTPGAKEARWLIDCSTLWARAHRITLRRPNPPQPPPFCMTLRKYLEGGRIESVAQRRFDRILDIEISGHEGQLYLLTAELMGRHSNIILLGPDERILQAAKLISARVNRVREILPGRAYVPPPATARPDPRQVTRDRFIAQLERERPDDLSEWLRSRFDGMSGLLAKEIARRAQAKPPLAVHPQAALHAWEAFAAIFEAARDGAWQPVQVRDEKGMVAGAYPFPLVTVAAEQQQPSPDIHRGLEDYYTIAIPREALDQQRRSLQGMLQKALGARYNAAEQVERGMRERGQSEKYRRYGELILAYLRQVPAGQSAAELLDYYTDPPQAITVPLDPALTPQQNAERYFQRARHVESNAERLVALHERLRSETDELEASLARVQSATAPAALDTVRTQAALRGWLQPTGGVATGEAGPTRPDFDGKRIRAYISPEGYTVLVGENAEANDYLVRQVAQSNDWWLHVRAGTSAHVVIRTGNAPQRVPQGTLFFAAQLAAAHSRGKHAAVIAVDYTLRKYVRRPRGAAPGAVLYTHEKTLDVAPAQL